MVSTLERMPGVPWARGSLGKIPWWRVTWTSVRVAVLILGGVTHAGRPPLRGSVRACSLGTRKPSSQSREQEDHGPQAAQPPLTMSGEVPRCAGDLGLEEQGADLLKMLSRFQSVR